MKRKKTKTAEQTPLSQKGVYLLFVHVKAKLSLRIGALGVIDFEPGVYLYVGSAMGGFNKRIPRYLRPILRKRWHIDYLLEAAEVVAVLLIPSSVPIESEITSKLMKLKFLKPYAKGFGASDTADETHLFKIRWDLLSKNPQTAE
ncbi:MAG: hypothetical protein DRQ10_05750 [Candidatus Hydrothermota bacterium]|nr:MAG: hypothetical protein DRQ10_05750 [Candidatus Hydrothermae bacterium]